jgi:hypothetical protein
MMAYGRGGGARKSFDNNMRVVLFANEEKRRGKKDPDMRGSLQIDGNKYWIDVWWNEHDKKGEYLSGNLKLQEEQSPQQRNQSRNSGRRDERDDDPQPQRRGGRQEEEPPARGRGRTNRDNDPEDGLDDIPF